MRYIFGLWYGYMKQDTLPLTCCIRVKNVKLVPLSHLLAEEAVSCSEDEGARTEG